MADMRLPEVNKVILAGRVTKDLELKYTPANQAVTNFQIAVDRRYKDAQTGEWKSLPSFITIVSWGKQAEIAADRLKKGNAIYVEGRLQSRSWESKQGEKRSTLEVIADKIQFMSINKSEDLAAEVNVEKKVASKDKDTAWDVETSVESLDEEIPF